MYGFEILAEISLTSDELKASKDEFEKIFKSALADSEIVVRVAALKAISAFILGIDDSTLARTYSNTLS